MESTIHELKNDIQKQFGFNLEIVSLNDEHKMEILLAQIESKVFAIIKSKEFSNKQIQDHLKILKANRAKILDFVSNKYSFVEDEQIYLKLALVDADDRIVLLNVYDQVLPSKEALQIFMEHKRFKTISKTHSDQNNKQIFQKNEYNEFGEEEMSEIEDFF